MHAAIAICLGACAGALLRWQLGLWLNHANAWLPWGTLAANLLGGYAVGLVLGALHQLPQLDPLWRVGLVTGFLGALTTFSSFSAEVVGMLLAGRHAQALATPAAHVGGSLLLTWAGLRTAAWLMPLLRSG
ncbi:MAG: fluoride efflux transporter CrcB [Pseudomonadota bacterium]|nr:fluoride efflux transporter CrcB [Pseudomonadota bacterium]